MRRLRVLLVFGGIAAAIVVARCTIFDGLEGRVITDAGTKDAGDEQALILGQQPGYLSLADGVAFCSNAFACTNLPTSTEFIDVPVDANHFSSCVDWVSGPLPSDRNGHDVTAAVLRCAAQAKSCDEAGGCLWDEVISLPDPRCAGKDAGALGSCGDDGGSVYFCGQNPGILHCANTYFQAGSVCVYDDAGSPWCDTPCTTDQCIGDVLSYCAIDGTQVSRNCGMLGMTCGFDNVEGFNDCLTQGSAKTCSALAVNCSGTTVAMCDGIYVSDYDCSTYGGACDQSVFPRCKKPYETCTPFDGDIDVCTGTSISLCVNGQKTSFDCSSIGKTCAAASGGQSGHCQ